MSKGERRPFTRTEWIVLAALVASILVAVLIPTAFWFARDRQIAQQESQQETRRIEACRAYNLDQQRNRVFVVEDKRQLGVVFFDLTPEEIAELEPDFLEFAAFAAEAFPYRTCTPACVDAHYDPALADCPPADNPEGKP